MVNYNSLDTLENWEWPIHPEDNLWYYEKVQCNWIYDLIILAGKRTLEEEDVFENPKQQSCRKFSQTFWNSWFWECENASKAHREPTLLWSLWHGFKGQFLIGTVTQFGFAIAQLGQPYLIAELVGFIATGDGGVQRGVSLAFGLAAVSLASSLLMSATLFAMRRVGLAIRNGIMMACYEHSLQLTASARATLTIGKTTSLLAIDSEKLMMAAMFAGYLWHGPLAAFVIMLLLVREVGWAAAACGLAWILILIPTQLLIAQFIGKCKRDMLKYTDERVKLSNEILSTIRAIKLYAWEVPMVNRILTSRQTETLYLWYSLTFNGMLRELLFIAGPMCSLVIFSVRIYAQGQSLSLVQVFRVLALINVLRFPLNLLGQALKFCQEGIVSINRLDQFFALSSSDCAKNKQDLLSKYSMVHFRNATFSWNYNKDNIKDEANIRTLQNLNLKLSGKGGQLVAIIGSVGSGKSSILSAILKEIPLQNIQEDGKLTAAQISGEIAYCAQQPWIQNMTLRDNILFGYQMSSDVDENNSEENEKSSKEERIRDRNVRSSYDNAIEAAALLPDLQILRQGDLTEIGERGVNLSGGQKSRVSIARALFVASQRSNDIVLFDDPFSAVDGDTGNFIFHNGVVPLVNQEDSNKLVVVCLNSHLHLLSHFDRIVIISDGKIICDGSPEDLSNNKKNSIILHEASGIEEGELKRLILDAKKEKEKEKKAKKSRSEASFSNNSNLEVTTENIMGEFKSELEKKKEGKLILAEHREKGVIKWRIYLDYFAAAFWKKNVMSENNIYSSSLGSDSQVSGNHISNLHFILGICVGTLLIIIFTAAQAARILFDFSIASWGQSGGSPNSEWAYIFYGSFIILFLLLCTRSVYLNYWSVASAQSLHIYVIHKIIQAPVVIFFDTHSVGEILNKLSRDTEIIDSHVPEFLLQFCINSFQVLSTFALCIWSSPYVALIFIPLCYGFFVMCGIFSCVSRDMKRLESVTRSPIYSSISETLTGLETIRAYGETGRFRKQHLQRMEKNGKFFFHLWMCTSWMTCRLEIATTFILLMVSLFSVIFRDSTSEIALGLALSYGLQLTALFQRCVQLAIDVSVYMTSTERVLEFMTIEQEKSTNNVIERSDLTTHTTVPSSSEVISVENLEWPRDGLIEFNHVTFRYRDNPPALVDVSFVVQPGERVGVCGRTGAGKSSLMFALFRMEEVENGFISIDGAIISEQVPLALLRKSLAIIPQDPVLITGSLRFQLDPFEIYSDEEIWDVLNVVTMRKHVKAMSQGLQTLVEEGGSNLSHGQRQLICIARALLRKTKVLVIDEGTSAVDPATDIAIQTALRVSATKNGTTILAIAHRLATIKDFDKILVMGDGKVLEYDTPQSLLANQNSQFAKMILDNKESNN